MTKLKERLKCAIIVPPEVGPIFPRGAVELASFLDTKGVAVSLLHMGLLPTLNTEKTRLPQGKENGLDLEVREFLKREQPDVVGVSCLFSISYPSCLEILRTSKEVRPQAVTVIGGPHPTFTDLETVQENSVDVVVRGEGEWTMLYLLEAIENGLSLTEVDGLTIERNGEPFRTGVREDGDLSVLELPKFSFFTQDQLEKMQFYGLASRGCNYRCRYCVESRFWGCRRHYLANRIIDEIEVLKLQHGVDMLGIEDSMVHLGSSELVDFCTEAKRRAVTIPPFFYVLSRPDTVTNEGLTLLRESGIGQVRIGIESGSETVRRSMGKTFSNDDIRTACRSLRDNGTSVFTFWMLGHPGDNPREARKSLNFMEELFRDGLINYVALALFIPYPGTEFFSDPRKHGIRILTQDWAKWERWTSVPMCELESFPANEISRFYLEALEIIKKYERFQDLPETAHEFVARIRNGSL